MRDAGFHLIRQNLRFCHLPHQGEGLRETREGTETPYNPRPFSINPQRWFVFAPFAAGACKDRHIFCGTKLYMLSILPLGDLLCNLAMRQYVWGASQSAAYPQSRVIHLASSG